MSPEVVVSINQNHADRATFQRGVIKQTAYKRRRRPNWHFWNRLSVCSQREPFSTPLNTVCQVYMGSCTAGRLSTWAGVGLGAKHQLQSQLCSHRWSFRVLQSMLQVIKDKKCALHPTIRIKCWEQKDTVNNFCVTKRLRFTWHIRPTKAKSGPLFATFFDKCAEVSAKTRPIQFVQNNSIQQSCLLRWIQSFSKSTTK